MSRCVNAESSEEICSNFFCYSHDVHFLMYIIYQCTMCTTNINTVHNVTCICKTNNFTIPFRGVLKIINNCYSKIQEARLIFVLT